MIKRMEIRFTIVAIIVISSVLLVMLVGVNLITRTQNINRADSTLLEVATDVHDPFAPVATDATDVVNHRVPNTTEDWRTNTPKPGTEAFDEFDRAFDTMDAKDENRSFEILISSDLEFIDTSSVDKNMTDYKTSYELALLAEDLGVEQGFVEEYRFLRVEEEEAIRYIFIDYTYERNSEISFMWVSVAFFVIAVGLVILLVILFMKPVMKPIRDAYTKQKQFITDASHELKTPLTVISTNMQLVEMEQGTSDWTDSIKNQVERMKQLSNDLVTLSRLDEQESRLEMTALNLSEIVNDVAMGFEPAFLGKGMDFQLDVEEELMVQGDYDALEKVVSVLLHNALKYSTPDGYVKVSLKHKGKKRQLVVENATDQLEKGPRNELFERFYRGDKSRNSKTGGFGIGLAIAKSTIEDHGGRIEAYSQDGHSLTVSILL
jgi:signal transduction histidine kinase